MKSTNVSSETRLSRPVRIMTASFIVLFLAGITTLVIIFSQKEPSIKVAIIYPEKNVAIAVVARESADGFLPGCSMVQDGGDTAYVYPDKDKPIDEYENVTFVEHPTKFDVVRQEVYPISIEDGEKMRKIVIYGDGRMESWILK